jgi:class 3 adenylate cyclase
MPGELHSMLPTEPEHPEIRISDADRNKVVDLLRQHCSEGRLTLDEFSDRVGDVFAAKTRAELEKVTIDLPVAPLDLPGAAWPPAPAEASTRRRAVRRWIVGIMSGGRARGRWRPAEETTVVAVMGGCEVDLRNAEIDGPEVTIRAFALMGGVDIIVPEGIEVELTGFAFMGGKESRIKDVPVLPGSPLIRVQAFALMGGVTVRSKATGEKTPRQALRDGVRDFHELKQVKLEQMLERAAERINEELSLHGLPASTPAPQPASAPAPVGQHRTNGAPAGTVTILFSDIEGFSSMTERLGDRKAQEIVRVHNAIVRGNVGACGGFEVKSQGDGFMIAFDSASKALRCAQAVQHELAAYTKSHPDEPVRVRMGLHTGEAIKDQDDFLGRTVIVASRIADEACGGEILVSSLLQELVKGTGEFRFGEAREVELKGLTGKQEVVSVNWSA